MKRKILAAILSLTLASTLVAPAYAMEGVGENIGSYENAGSSLETEATQAETEAGPAAETEASEADEAQSVGAETATAEETESVLAEETSEATTEEAVPEATYIAPNEGHAELADINSLSSEQMYEAYVRQAFGLENELELADANQREQLNQYEKNLYDYLKTEIEKIMAGERTDTVFHIPADVIGLKYKYSAEELGYTEITGENGTEASKKIQEIWANNLSSKSVINALLADMPYDLFWYDRTSAKNWTYDRDSVDITSDEADIIFPKTGIYISFNVINAYRASADANTSIDSNKIKAPAAAAKSARELAASYSSLSDEERLDKYREEICNRAELDTEVDAVEALQLMYVFDGDPATKVSGLGYAVAFKYLCDNSDFKSDNIKAHILYGAITEAKSGLKNMNHTWNLLQMSNGKNYFVDLAYCDKGQIGESDKLFLAGATVKDNGFLVKLNDGYAGYAYRSDTAKNYSGYAISETGYYAHDYSGLTNKDLRVEFDSIIANEKDANGKYRLNYRVYAKCKCARCLKENPEGKENIIHAGSITIEDKNITVKPSCLKDGKLGVGLTTSPMDYLGNGSTTKFSIPSVPVAKYGSHDWDKEITYNEGQPDEVIKKQCKRCNLIDEHYTKLTKPVCEVPDNLEADFGTKLYDLVIANKAGNTEGSFEWQDKDQILNREGENIFLAKFTPKETDKYQPVKNIEVTVKVRHVHAIDKKRFHKEVPATQTVPGKAAYYECANGCDAKLNDKAVAMTDEELVIKTLPITLILKANGGKFPDGSQEQKYSLTYGEAYPELATPVAREGYSLETGWFETLTATSRAELGSKVMLTGDTVLYAHWKGLPRTIRFNEASEEYTIDNGKSLRDANKKLPNIEKDGLILLGWYTEADGKGQRFTEDTVVSSDLSLYPYFKKAGLNFELDQNTYTFTGSQIKPEIKTIEYNGIPLEKGRDYTVTYKNNIKAYSTDDKEASVLEKTAPAVIISCKGNYTGSYKKYFTIKPKDLGDSDISVTDIATVLETGRDIKPLPTVSWDKLKLVNNRDYIVEYYSDPECNNKVTPKAAATYFIKITAKKDGNYSGEVKAKRFEIVSKDKVLFSKLKISIPKTKAYTGEEITLAPNEIIIKDGKTTLGSEQYELKYSDNHTDIGDVTLTISSKDSKYIGSKTLSFKITGTSLKKAKLEGFKASLDYTGEELKQAAEFKLNAGVLKGASADEYKTMSAEDKKSVAYTYEYQNNKEIGKATVIYKGVNAYTDTITKTFMIKGETLAGAKFKDNFTPAFTYTGSELKQPDNLVVTDKKGNILKLVAADATDADKKDKDATVAYTNNIKAGTATMTLTGINKYSGSLKKTFKINAFDIKANPGNLLSIAIDKNEYNYAKAGVTPEPEVFFAGELLEKGKDYTVAYLNNKDVNDGSGLKKPIIKITGKGNFKGINDSKTFVINSKILTSEDIQVIVDNKAEVNRPGAWKSVVTVYDGNTKLTANADYSIEFYYAKNGINIHNGNVEKLRAAGEKVDIKDIVPAGNEIRVVITASGKNKRYSGSNATAVYSIGKTDISKLKFTINPKAYTGSEIRLDYSDFTVSLQNKPVTFSEDSFEIVASSYKNNIKKGKATVVIKGKGDYCGSKTLSFTISSRTIN